MAKKRSAKKSKKHSKAASAFPLWRLWLLSGLVIVICLVGLQFLQKDKLKPSLFNTVFSENKVAAKPKHLEPSFEFYEMLPKDDQKQVQKKPADIEKAKEVSLAKTDSASSQSNSSKLPTYVLQVASFKTYEDADTVKAKLILKGFPASIQTAKINDETRYRIMVGPYTDKDVLAAAKMELNQEHYSCFQLPAS